MTALPLGVENNNPGNIRPGDPWQGLAPTQRDDFCVFLSPDWGFRAMARNLIAYYDGARGATPCRSVRTIISRWAPPADNNPTAAYIAAVCKTTGFDPDETLNLHGYEDCWKLCRAMTIQEQGSFDKYFTKESLDEGLRKAGCEDCPAAPVKRSPAVIVSAGAGAAVAGAQAVLPEVIGAKATVESLFGASKYVPVILAVIFMGLLLSHWSASKK